MSDSKTALGFAELGLPAVLLSAVTKLGYSTPSPIQAQTIPLLLQGRDLIGQAQTGTGKTAAFALPILARLQLEQRQPQALVLTPTRELAIQVTAAFQSYAQELPGFTALAVYGGQDMRGQLQQLRRGVHLVVGTPGRLLDHLRRKSLDLSQVRTLVLDEADEMLRMGFIEDVENILSHTAADKQTVLFSATLPSAIQAIARRFLKQPEHIRISSQTTTVAAIDQCYWLLNIRQKLEALTKLVETEDFDAMIVFTRTRETTTELAAKIAALGYDCAALNGDMSQAQREATIKQLKDGRINILIATDVAARGLDVGRITHVVNYDIPMDAEAYVHRIGRTGRAGRSGRAILLVTGREQRLLKSIERATGQPIRPANMPTAAEVSSRRIAQFKQRILASVTTQEDSFYNELLTQLCHESGHSLVSVAAGMVRLLEQGNPLQPAARIKEVSTEAIKSASQHKRKNEAEHNAAKHSTGKHSPAKHSSAKHSNAKQGTGEQSTAKHSTVKHSTIKHSLAKPSTAKHYTTKSSADEQNAPSARKPKVTRDVDGKVVTMEWYRLEAGKQHGTTQADILGAVASESGLHRRFIGKISIFEQHSEVELPHGMPADLLQHMQKVWICNQRMKLRPLHSMHNAGDAKGNAQVQKKFNKPSSTTKPTNSKSKTSKTRRPIHAQGQ